MTSDAVTKLTIGWIGAGRMGFPMAELLLKAGADVSVYNRTASKAEPLTAFGARIVEKPSGLADRGVVFAMVAGPDDLRAVVMGPDGLLANPSATPRIVVDCSSVDEEASEDVRRALAERGAAFLAAPVSGNGKVVKARKLTIVSSGPKEVFDEVRALLEVMAPSGVTWGRGGRSRPDLQDLPQRDARGGHPMPLGDHRSRRAGGRAAFGLPRIHERVGDGLDVHALQVAGPGESRLHHHLHPAAPAPRTSISGSRSAARWTCRCRSPR